MKHIVEGIGALLAVLAWIAGTVLAPGWWKLAAFVFPPYHGIWWWSAPCGHWA